MILPGSLQNLRRLGGVETWALPLCPNDELDDIWMIYVFKFDELDRTWSLKIVGTYVVLFDAGGHGPANHSFFFQSKALSQQVCGHLAWDLEDLLTAS